MHHLNAKSLSYIMLHKLINVMHIQASEMAATLRNLFPFLQASDLQFRKVFIYFVLQLPSSKHTDSNNE